MTDETYVDWSGREQEDADPRDALEPKSVLDHPGYEERMMPGQTPYTDEERERLHGLVADAAEGDPGEQEEPDPLEISDADAMAILAAGLGTETPHGIIAWDILAWAKNAIDEQATHYWENGFGQEPHQLAAALYWLGGQIDALTRRLQSADEAMPQDTESADWGMPGRGLDQAANLFDEAIRPSGEEAAAD